MTDKIRLISPPDQILDRSRSILAICLQQDLKNHLEDYLLNIDETINVYVFTEQDKDIQWLLTNVNLADTIIFDIDGCSPSVSHFISYILSFSNTYYRCTNKVAEWDLLNLNRFYDFPKI